MTNKTPTPGQAAILKSNDWHRYEIVPIGNTCCQCHREIIKAAGWMSPSGSYYHDGCVLEVKTVQVLLDQPRLFD